MKYKFIPVNNNLDKAVAFANSLDNNFVVNQQKIKQKPNYINPLEIVKILQEDGWELKGVDEHRNNRRQIVSHYLDLQHPDFTIKDINGNGTSLASIKIQNNCNGNKPIQLNLGMYRQVCSNGLIAKTDISKSSIPHINMDYSTLYNKIQNLQSEIEPTLKYFQNFQNYTLTPQQMQDFLNEAIRLRYSENEIQNINLNSLGTPNRPEDSGNNLFNVFNRVQENLTFNIKNNNQDILINQGLTNLADQYAITA
jgi:hypothetical protein